MNRICSRHAVTLDDEFRKKLLIWADQFDEIAWLDSNHYKQEHSSFQAVLAVEAFTSIQTDYVDAFSKLDEYQSSIKDWLFGYLTYDLKNDTEQLTSRNHDGLEFPDLYFFQPKKLFFFSENSVELRYLNLVADEIDNDWNEILNTNASEEPSDGPHQPVKIKLRTTKDTYFEEVNTMLSHIERGDIYEANFCQEFFSEDIIIDPLKTFYHLNEISRPPFATYLKFGKKYAMCASPERYLKKEGKEVLSQPIKGTAKRFKDQELDREMIEKLKNDPKERSENIMITDLVRNDLSRFAETGSVVVEELCAVYTFEQVHQLISTVRCLVSEDAKPAMLLKDTFPMGSMTGAPKVSAMKIIEKLEDAKRGLYSGAIGYFSPNNDFDFNVVIRSILYNAERKYVSYSVGGAITAKSIVENEYEECLLKAKAMREALERTN